MDISAKLRYPYIPCSQKGAEYARYRDQTEPILVSSAESYKINWYWTLIPGKTYAIKSAVFNYLFHGST